MNNVSGFCQINPQGLCVYTNAQTCRMTGYSLEEMLGSGWVRALHPEDRERVIAKWDQCKENLDTFCTDFRILRKDGGVVWVSGQIAPFLDGDGRVLGYTVAVSDISSKKLAEKALRLSEERFSKAFNASPSLIAIYRLADDRFIDVNDSFLNTVGYSRAEVVGHTITELKFWVKPETRMCMAGLLQRQEKVQNLESRFFTKSGEVRIGLISAEIIELNGEDCMFVVINDITELKQAQAAIESERRRLFIVLHNLPANIALVSPDYNVRFANNTFCEHFGITYGKLCYEALYGRQAPCESCQIDKIFQEGVPLKWEQLHSGNSYQVYGYPFYDIDGSPLVLMMAIDVSELKQLKEEVLRLDRLNLVGEMAAGIGHEIRNPMTTVRGFLQLLGGKKECAVYKDFFELMIEELDRANAIITEYLTLAKNKSIELKEHNLNSIVKAIFPLIQADAMRSDKFVVMDLGEVTDLLLDEKEIRQLIINLARNGLEAMPSGGTLTLRTYMKDDKVILEVQDKGRGISPEALKKLGTPFFTTKDNGTGLGLAVCYSIATRHKAKIEVETSSNGTVFVVQFQMGNLPEHQMGLPA